MRSTKTTLIVLVSFALLVTCGSPPSKENGVTNNGASNATTNNGASNASTNNGASNATTNNGASNATTNNGTTSGRDIWASDYDQSCEYDGDCVVVHEGDACLCGGNACGNTGIAAAELERWESDRGAACPDGEEMCSLAPCFELLAACVDGTCTAREPVYVDATEWDRSCQNDDECVIVHEGEVCQTCVCGGTAVNVAHEAEYQALLESAECTPGPDPCDCATVEEAWCNGGTCEPGVGPG